MIGSFGGLFYKDTRLVYSDYFHSTVTDCRGSVPGSEPRYGHSWLGNPDCVVILLLRGYGEAAGGGMVHNLGGGGLNWFEFTVYTIEAETEGRGREGGNKCRAQFDTPGRL